MLQRRKMHALRAFVVIGLLKACSTFVAQPLTTHRISRHAHLAALSGLLFDCDGVLADTEPNAHRPSFNQAFAEKEFPDVWDIER